ncbi:MAG: ABC transporter ATP-binding protein [Spirochaetales bacterium]
MIKIFRFLKPYWVLVVATLVLVFIQSLADLYLPTLMSSIINDGVMKGNTDKILQIGGLMLLFTFGGMLVSIIASLFSSRIALGLGRKLRSEVFGRVTSFSLEEYDRFGASTLITRSTNDIVQVTNVTVMMLRMMVAAPMMMIGGIILAWDQDTGLTFILAYAIPVLLLLVAAVMWKGLPLFQAMQVKIDKINLVLREKLTGIRVIRAFGREDRENVRFEAANADLTQNYIKVNRIMAFLMPSIMLIMSLTQLAILWFGIVRIDAGDMQIGALMAFTQYAVQILMSLMMVSMVFIMVPRAASAAKRINEVLAVVPVINDPGAFAAADAPTKAPAVSGETAPAANTPSGRVEFRNVSFAYHGAEQKAIEGLSFVAEPGKVTAIIGSTGAGKTSLLNLIPRFYEVAEGQVLVSGTDVREQTQKALRAQIGYIPQKALLFSGTIAENLKHGKSDASAEEIASAVRTAQSETFIAEMDGGLDHVLAQGGTNVSGGQKQRLAIARALVRKPKIYLFDDSFSALDYKTDRNLRTALKAETTDATVIIVAQRVGTIRDADQILVLEEGKLVGQGTHTELMANCPTYQEIVASQLSQEEAV